MPWAPELFSTPALEAITEKSRFERLSFVPFFDGLMTGETDALIGSFAGEPELHHPVRGRIKGVRALERYANETKAWLEERSGTVEDVNVILTPRGGAEEVLIHVDSGQGRVALPMAVAGEHDENNRFAELRVY